MPGYGKSITAPMQYIPSDLFIFSLGAKFVKTIYCHIAFY